MLARLAVVYKSKCVTHGHATVGPTPPIKSKYKVSVLVRNVASLKLSLQIEVVT